MREKSNFTRIFQSLSCVTAVSLLLVTPLLAEATGKFIGAKTATHPDWFKVSFLDFSEDIDEAAADGKRLALYFWQAGCPYCNQLWEHNMAVPGIQENFKSNFDVVAINMWGDDEVVSVGGKSFSEKQLAQALNVDFTPTIIFYTEQKKPALRLNGYYPPDEFNAALNYVKEKQEDIQSFAEYSVTKLAQANQNEGDLVFRQDYFKSVESISARSHVEAEKPLAILFESPNCKACEILHTKTLADETTKSLFQKMHVIQLSVTDSAKIKKPSGEPTTAQQWAKELGLAYFPSIVFFDKQGQYIMKMDSALRTFHTQSIFAYVLEKAYLTEPNFQHYISSRADYLRKQGIDVDIWRY